MQLNKTIQIEKYLKEKILSDLDKGRPYFDKPHTLAVVHWLKQIIKNSPELNINKNILLIAAYAHDWGYAGMFKKYQRVQLDEVKKAKSEHMRLGAIKIRKLLTDNFFSFLDDRQKKRCIHLVAVHDKIDELKDDDELILLEADTLGGMDIERVIPTFDHRSNKTYIKRVKEKRLPKFVTKFGKMTAKILIQGNKKYYTDKKSTY